jgi:hypothetical protein
VRKLYLFNWALGLAFVVFFSIGEAFSTPDKTNTNSQSFLVRPWVVGQSIALQTKTYQEGNLTSTETVSYSIVDQEKVNGKDFLWVEIEQTLGDGVTITKKLQVRQPEAVDFENVLSMGVEHGLILQNQLLKTLPRINRSKSKRVRSKPPSFPMFFHRPHPPRALRRFRRSQTRVPNLTMPGEVLIFRFGVW